MEENEIKSFLYVSSDYSDGQEDNNTAGQQCRHMSFLVRYHGGFKTSPEASPLGNTEIKGSQSEAPTR